MGPNPNLSQSNESQTESVSTEWDTLTQDTPEVVTNLANENATDRNPYDAISPEADASNNLFETNPDDSVDITNEYDDAKAQAIEATLQPVVENNPDTNEAIASHEDYQKFATQRFSELVDALDNPEINSSPDTEQEIYDQIALTAELLINADESDPFALITDKYEQRALAASEDGDQHRAERNRRFADGVQQMMGKFGSFMHPEPDGDAERQS